MLIWFKGVVTSIGVDNINFNVDDIETVLGTNSSDTFIYSQDSGVSIDGRGGDDLLDLSNFTTGASVNLGQQTVEPLAENAFRAFTFESINSVTGTNFADEIVTHGGGDAEENTTEVNGGGGNDVITVLDGSRINGGAGNDVITIAGGLGVSVAGGGDRDTFRLLETAEFRTDLTILDFNFSQNDEFEIVTNMIIVNSQDSFEEFIGVNLARSTRQFSSVDVGVEDVGEITFFNVIDINDELTEARIDDILVGNIPD